MNPVRKSNDNGGNHVSGSDCNGAKLSNGVKKVQPLVSIITPTYNHEKFLAECIESVLAQTFPYWEMIIIDDASTDKTFQIANEYAKKDKRIKIIRHDKNWGIYMLAEIYNEALALSIGEFVAVLEGDDLWLKDKLASQLEIFKDSEVILGYGKAAEISADSKVVKSVKGNYKPQFFTDTPRCMYEEFMLNANFIPALTVMIRKEALVKVGGFIQPFDIPTVDFPTWLMLSFKGKFYGSSKLLAYHRYQPNSQSAQKLVEIVQREEKFLWQIANEHIKKIYDNDKFLIFQKKLSQYTKSRLSRIYMLSGRYRLIEKETKSAINNFLQGLFVEGTLTGTVIFAKFKCLIGIILAIATSVFGFTLEPAIDWLGGRKTLISQAR